MAFGEVDAFPLSVTALRAEIERFAAASPDAERAVRALKRHEIPGPDGGLEILAYRSQNAPAQCPVVLYIHGGGFIAGSPEADAVGILDLAETLDCLVVSPRYRLAPEARGPRQIEDCYVALKWLHDNAAELGGDPERTLIWGASAGGGLAAGLGLVARERGGPNIAGQMLIYPMLDDRTATRDDIAVPIGRHVWTQRWNRFAWSSYLGCEPGSEGVPPLAVPARAERLEGLPSTFVATAALDLFLDENLAFARRLMVAGVPTELHVASGAFHGFEAALDAPVTRRALHVRIEWARQLLSSD